MFTFYEEEDVYRAELKGILFVCQDEEEDYEVFAQDLADAYEERLPDILKLVKKAVCAACGEMMSVELIKEKLGRPTIDLDMYVITYLENTFAGDYIIEVEFDGVLDELLEVNVEG